MNLRFAICDLRLGLSATMATALVLGCIGNPSNPAATQPVTIVDPATTQPGYWYSAPPPGSVVYDDFTTLFKTAEDVMRDFGFRIDRVDYRTGLLTSYPLVSAQIFEPWRPDIQTLDAATESTLASVRRTLRFEFTRNDNGSFELFPKVLVERQTVAERRITNVALYRGAYGMELPKDAPRGTKESDAGFRVPQRYWYLVARDPALERKLAKEVSARLASQGQVIRSTTSSEAP